MKKQNLWALRVKSTGKICYSTALFPRNFDSSFSNDILLIFPRRYEARRHFKENNLSHRQYFIEKI
jgi:hypothetical protein